jgi:UrcA family protein
MMKAKISALAAAACMAAGLASAPALAVDGETFVFRVNAAALETDAEVRSAYQRLTTEATRYCHALDLTMERDVAVCRIDVVANVVEAVGDERLVAVHRDATRERQIAAAG